MGLNPLHGPSVIRHRIVDIVLQAMLLDQAVLFKDDAAYGCNRLVSGTAPFDNTTASRALSAWRPPELLNATSRRALAAHVADELGTHSQSGNTNRGEVRSSRVRWRNLLPFGLWPLVLPASLVPRHVRCLEPAA